MTGPTATFKKHPASLLMHDERVQRAVRPARVSEIARKLDPKAIGVVTVSERGDGNLYLLDGQHRVLALIQAGRGDTPVSCRVMRGLTVAEEAGLFRRLNNTSKTTAIEDLLKGITEGDEESVAIAAIADRYGLRIALDKADGVIACATSMRRVFRSASHGPAALGFALHVATSAWGVQGDSVEGTVVSGLGMMYHRDGEAIDRKALIAKLSKHEGGAAGLLGHAKSARSFRHGTTLARCVAAVATDVYNRGRKDRLAAF